MLSTSSSVRRENVCVFSQLLVTVARGGMAENKAQRGSVGPQTKGGFGGTPTSGWKAFYCPIGAVKLPVLYTGIACQTVQALYACPACRFVQALKWCKKAANLFRLTAYVPLCWDGEYFVGYQLYKPLLGILRLHFYNNISRMFNI